MMNNCSANSVQDDIDDTPFRHCISRVTAIKPIICFPRQKCAFITGVHLHKCISIYHVATAANTINKNRYPLAKPKGDVSNMITSVQMGIKEVMCQFVLKQ